MANELEASHILTLHSKSLQEQRMRGGTQNKMLHFMPIVEDGAYQPLSDRKREIKYLCCYCCCFLNKKNKAETGSDLGEVLQGCLCHFPPALSSMWQDVGIGRGRMF